MPYRREHGPRALAALSMLALLLALAGCSRTPFKSEYDVVVVRTSGSTKGSQLLFYDRDLQLVQSLKVGMTSLQMTANPAALDGHHALLFEQGYDKVKNGRGALSFDLRNGTWTEHPSTASSLRGGIYCGERIYVEHNRNMIGYLTAIDRQSSEEMQRPFEGEIIVGMAADGATLHLSLHTVRGVDDRGRILSLEPDGTERSNPIPREYGIPTYALCLAREALYIPCFPASGDDQASDCVLRFDLARRQFERIGSGTPMSRDLFYDQDKYLYMSGDFEDSHRLLRFDLDTGVWTPFDMGRITHHIAVTSTTLYAVDQEQLRRYRLSEDGIELVGQVELPRLRTFAYPSALFCPSLPDTGPGAAP